MNITPSEQEIIVKAIDGFIFGSIAFIARFIWKVLDSVSSIPKIREDLNTAHQKIRDLESKLK